MNILFVCLGNICRSPMAESIFKHILVREQVTDEFQVDSAGLIAYHAGELADIRMRSHAQNRGYEINHLSRPFVTSDFERFDIIIGMDDQNIKGLTNLAKTVDNTKKIFRMTDYCQKIKTDNVPDPYYGGSEGFEFVINLLEDACEGLFLKLKK